MGRKLEASLAILNGAIGDYLVRTGNGLATTMALVARSGDDVPLAFERAALTRALPEASPHVAIFVHGLMSTETIWTMSDGTDYGTLLARDLGVTPLYVRYNSGLAIADNGANLSRALDAFVAAYPVPIESLVTVGHSMGGLVIRSACHVARLERRAWLPLVKKAIYVGTPHLGAPLERVGRTVSRLLRTIDDPYARLVGEIADLRSDGLKDLGDADLRHEDRAANAARGSDRLRDPNHPVPLLPEIQHYLVAGTLARSAWLATLFGDSLVPVRSATAGLVDPASGALPPSHVKVLDGMSHIMLARDAEVYAAIRNWCR
jgi:pimeloyl-ACP methyl ester carboxylesterase